MFVTLLTLFVIKHFIADFVLQFNYMIEEKGRYLATGGVQHSAIHGILTYFILLYFTNPHTASMLALLDFVIHYHIDWAKMNLSQGLTTDNHKFWIWLGFDQMLHYLTYILIIGILL
jgi:hypothetical protein